MSFNNTKSPTKSDKKPRWQIPMRQGRTNAPEYYLEGELLERFCKLFPKHSNRRIMQWFGIGFGTLQRLKRKHHLTKDMKAVRKELAQDVKKKCEKNGWYDSLRGKAPSPECMEGYRRKLAEGWHPLKALKAKNPRKYKKMIQERSRKRSELIRKERLRVRLGLTPHTNLTPHMIGAVLPFNRRQICQRNNARRKGYITGDIVQERYIIFYDEDTQRGKRFEHNLQSEGFQVLPLTD